MMTEFYGLDWGGGSGLDVEMTSKLERLGVSWLTFLGIGDANVTQNVGVSKYISRILCGSRWPIMTPPDYGYWPVARGPYGEWRPAAEHDDQLGRQRVDRHAAHPAEDFDNGGQGVAYK